jgi:hypothetical protein
VCTQDRLGGSRPPETTPCILQSVHEPVGGIEWPDRADLPGATYCPLCFKCLGGTRAPEGWPCDASPVESCADFERREGFGAAYAREQQAHAWADELAELREQADIDPSVRRARFDITKLLMSKRAPRLRRQDHPGDPDAALFRGAVEEINCMSEAELLAFERFAMSIQAAREAQAVEEEK